MSLSTSPRNESNWLGVGRNRSTSTSSTTSPSLPTSSTFANPTSFKLHNEPKVIVKPKDYIHFKQEFLMAFQQGDHLPSTIAIYALFSGILLGMGLTITIFLKGQRALGFYVGSLGLFHFLEYLTTSVFNPKRVKLESFMYDPVTGYHLALTVSIFEYLIKKSYYPTIYYYVIPIQILGVLMVIVGQWFRSRAMIEASTSFNHHVASMKDQDHHLITTGVFSLVRHPSYLGFYMFTMGTQLVLFNPICFLAFAFVLHQFFSSRIRVEEAHLIRFFGTDYKQFRDQTPTYLPFIN